VAPFWPEGNQSCEKFKEASVLEGGKPGGTASKDSSRAYQTVVWFVQDGSFFKYKIICCKLKNC